MVTTAPGLGPVLESQQRRAAQTSHPTIPAHRWGPWDWVAAAGLFAATAAVILWQNAHVAVFWDISYVLDTAMRIAQGQMPYRDFPLVHAPGTFLVQAALIRLSGRVYWHNILYAATMGGLGSVLAWRIALTVLRERVRAAWAVSLMLAAPLAVVGLYCVFPYPSYDCDCAFLMLVAVWGLQRVDREPHPSDKDRNVARVGHPGPAWGQGFAAGVLGCLPLFFKQNMGLPFLAAVVGAVAILLIWSSIRRPQRRTPDARVLLATLAGIAATLTVAAFILHFTVGMGNYLHWTIGFAAQRRMPGMEAMLSVYRQTDLVWMLPCVAAGVYLVWRTQDAARAGRLGSKCARIAAFFLFAAPFFWTLLSLLRFDDADERGDALLVIWPLVLIAAAIVALLRLWRAERLTMQELLPLVILAAVSGTFMSQQLWGSTYAIWPLLVLLIAELIAGVDSLARVSWFAPVMSAIIAATLLVCGAFYTASEERLSYASFPDGPAVHSAFPQLAGLATPGPYLPELDELLRYAADHIPQGDGLILLPGEDPFYFATGRVPQFPILLFDPSTDPFSPQQVAKLVQARGIRWMVVKRDLEIAADPTPNRAALLAALEPGFTLAARLRGYDVYRGKAVKE